MCLIKEVTLIFIFLPSNIINLGHFRWLPKETWSYDFFPEVSSLKKIGDALSTHYMEIGSWPHVYFIQLPHPNAQSHPFVNGNTDKSLR